MSGLRKFVNANIRVCASLDRLAPAACRVDGNKYFITHMLPRAFTPGAFVYDLGGGSRPCVSLDMKTELNLRVVGLDLRAEELAAAPAGIYDEAVAADLCSFRGDEKADVVVCQATLEHVPNVRGAMTALATSARPGARIFIFAPCRNALFARLNLLLPERLKRRVLFTLFPEKATGHDGFKAYYDRCTPRQIEALARENGLEVEEKRVFWTSSYFAAFVPAFVLWRILQFVAYALVGDNAAESFAYILRRPLPHGGLTSPEPEVWAPAS